MSNKKKRDIFSYVSSKYLKGKKPKYKKEFFEVLEMNRAIIKRNRKKSLYTGSVLDRQ